MYKLTVAVATMAALFAVVLCDRKQDALFPEYGSLGSRADFYSEEYLNGYQYSVELERGACKNFPKSWVNRAVSADTKGTCISGCDDKDCKGNCVYIYPNNGEQQLSQIKFDKKIVSVQGCFNKRT